MLGRIYLIAVFVAVLPAQDDLRRSFERARMLEEQNTNLNEAVRLYGEVAQRGKGERPLAARALFQQGLLYRRMGRTAEAARAWRTLIGEFPEQKELVQQARARLNPSGPRMNGVLNRRLFDGDSGTPSPDGRYLAFTDWATGNLALRDVNTGEQRTLTRKKEKWNESTAQALGAVFSPRGNTIAYQWMNQDGSVELRSVSVDGSQDRILFKDPNMVGCDPLDWSADGSRILVRLRGKDHLMSLGSVPSTGGAAAALMKPKMTLLSTAVFGPDSRGVFYTQLQEDKQGDDIYYLAPDGTDRPIVQHPANDYILGWAPGRQRIVFASDRLGTGSIWTLEVRAGVPAGDPVLVRENMGNIWPLGITSGGTLFYLVSTGTLDIYTAEIDVDRGTQVSPPKPIVSRYMGRNTFPSWSPDGELLLFHTQRNKTFGIYSLRTGRARQVEPQVARANRPQWFPGGKALFSSGVEANGRAGHYKIDMETGEASLVFPIEQTDSDFEGAWSADGRYYFNRPNDWRKGIYRIDTRSGEKKVLYVPPPGVAIGMENLAPSPDGKLLAFHASNRLTGENSLMLMGVDGGEAKPLLSVHQPERFAFGAFAWTPDSKVILAVRGVEGKNEIWKVPVDGGAPGKIGVRMKNMTVLRMNPDGRKIAFHAGEPASEIWLLEDFLPKERR